MLSYPQLQKEVVAAKELAPRKIRVNKVNPGPTKTEMHGTFGMDEATLHQLKQSSQSLLAQITATCPARWAAL
ncbi:SDR family oxidoreductase [Dyadobacter bucti]|uniref:SDR family oxidoreductase n=1 Tax=Dyadobacter bucti TaxID=2572203 RepID=UPI0011090A88